MKKIVVIKTGETKLFYSSKETADALGVCPNTITNLSKAGVLKQHCFGNGYFYLKQEVNELQELCLGGINIMKGEEAK